MFQLLFISFLSFSLLFLFLYTIRRNHQSPPLIIDIVRTLNSNNQNHSTENLKSSDSNLNNNQTAEKSESQATGDGECVKKKKKNKKPSDCDNLSKNRVIKEKENKGLVCLYPFTSSSSATQRKIKQQYDQLVKSHESNGLTHLQVGQFVNCLIEARDELKHKSEVIRRKFTITKALLFKADRSSFDRLRQQIYKLELEQKRIEEDASVYNWLQQQFKLSPAYKKMLEIGANMESKAKSIEPMEDTDPDIYDISFEELLAQEKKDFFWQKKGKPRSGSG